MALLNTYELFTGYKTEVAPLVYFEFQELLSGIKRRLTIRQTTKNPWSVKIRQKIHKRLFVQWFCAVRDYSTAYGRDSC